MKILVTSHHLQPISRKEKRKLVTDILILKLFTSSNECERFSAKNGLINLRHCRNSQKTLRANPRECGAENGEPRMGEGIMHFTLP